MNVGLMESTVFSNKSNLNFHNPNLTSNSNLSTSYGFGSLINTNFDCENFTSQDIEITDVSENCCFSDHKMFDSDLLNSGEKFAEILMDADSVLQNTENNNWRSALSSKDLSIFEFKQHYSRQNSQNCQLWQFLLGNLKILIDSFYFKI